MSYKSTNPYPPRRYFSRIHRTLLLLPPLSPTPTAPHQLANVTSRASSRLTTWLRVMRKLMRESAMATGGHAHDELASKKRPSAVLTHALANLIRRCPASAWAALGEADGNVGTGGSVSGVGDGVDGGGGSDFVAVGEALPLVFALVDDFDPTFHSVGWGRRSSLLLRNFRLPKTSPSA